MCGGERFYRILQHTQNVDTRMSPNWKESLLIELEVCCRRTWKIHFYQNVKIGKFSSANGRFSSFSKCRNQKRIWPGNFSAGKFHVNFPSFFEPKHFPIRKNCCFSRWKIQIFFQWYIYLNIYLYDWVKNRKINDLFS